MFRVILIIILLSFESYAQSNFQFGALPVLNINKKLPNNFAINFKAETRQVFYNEQALGWQHELVDISTIISKKIALNNSIAAGYLLRQEGNKVISRFIQQFVIIQNNTALRLAHRFSSDQTLEKDESVEWRFRYRISTQIPLNGQSVNRKEFYFKINNEYLYAIQQRTSDLEVRLVPFLGYQFTDSNKLEIGIDNRFDSLINELDVTSWLNINWFISI